MPAENRSKLVRIFVRNIGCVGNEGITIELDNVVCLVGKNNAGKSTVLRAYELAKGTETFDASRDRCQHATEDQESEVQLDVHIPENIGNIDARWKTERDGLLIVKSRWQWRSPAFTKTRTTWDPAAGEDGQGDWSSDGKAGGFDSVFGARLPRPLRICSFDDPEKTEAMLMALALNPLIDALEQERVTPESDLAKAISAVSTRVGAIGQAHEQHFNDIAKQVGAGFKGVFPSLDILLAIGAAPLVPKLPELLKSGSKLKVKDGEVETQLSQQGAGAQRALFWSMLQVHNELSRNSEIRTEHKKALEKKQGELEKQLAKKMTDDQRAVVAEDAAQNQAKLQALLAGGPIPENAEDPAFPGYILLIDEPENALHPLAARAAQRHLYRLAENPDWQVMITTHSPYFINPFEDHTTIIRLERSPDKGLIEPRTYRSDAIQFEADDKRRLQALQHIDPSFSEVFFGSYPILVEGDTEHATFLSSIIERQHELIDQVTIIRARGKPVLAPLVNVLAHFKMDFGIVHDADAPYKKNATANGMWTENKKIRDAIIAARTNGSVVRHRMSIPDFERYLGGDEETKEKPISAYLRVSSEGELATQVQQLLTELISAEDHDPFPTDLIDAHGYLPLLLEHVMKWAKEQGFQDEPRYSGVKPEPS
ncbi:AAA family ATPase [Pseudomonas solani]|uniref:AAA family ATPase n=1 Tax=Pseudomonas solani TaxID=2731552 RepID=A0AAU7Y862_9PSED